MKPNRVGLSEYTARRLAELQARRAEADDTRGISVGASSSAASAAEPSVVNDSNSSTLPSALTTPHPAVVPAYNNSTTASSSTVPAEQAAQPSNSHLFSLSNPSETASQVVPVPTTPASNSITSELSPDMADTTTKHKQLCNDESTPAEQRRVDRQDFTSSRATTEPSKLPVQRREIQQPSLVTRTGPHFHDSAPPLELGAMSKMVSFSFILQIFNKLRCYLLVIAVQYAVDLDNKAKSAKFIV